jgi:hypothetical protein
LRESKVEAHLKKLVKETGGVVRKVRWLGHRGAPDRWVGWPSTERTAWVELKKPATPHAEDHQAREHARLRSCGQTVVVLATIEAVDAFVERMTR